MPTVSIRSAGLADATSIGALHARSWQDAYRDILDHEYLARDLIGDRTRFWAHRLSQESDEQVVRLAHMACGSIAGFACALVGHDSQYGSLLDNLHVDPAVRGRGVGEILLISIAKHLATHSNVPGLYAWVFEANSGALKFYKNLGGQIADRAKSHMPQAGDQTLVRVFWPSINLQLAGEDYLE